MLCDVSVEKYSWSKEFEPVKVESNRSLEDMNLYKVKKENTPLKKTVAKKATTRPLMDLEKT